MIIVMLTSPFNGHFTNERWIACSTLVFPPLGWRTVGICDTGFRVDTYQENLGIRGKSGNLCGPGKLSKY